VTATWFLDNTLGGNHEWKFGVEYEQTYVDWDWWREDPYIFYWYRGSIYGYTSSSYDNRGRIYVYTCGGGQGSSVVKDKMTRLGAYLQDSWTIGDKLTINLGVRFDTSKGFIPEQFVGETADPYGILFTLLAPGTSAYS
jgi:outer membrane receptor protein involved in Fe transport